MVEVGVWLGLFKGVFLKWAATTISAPAFPNLFEPEDTA
jgi:hypothetical protein